ncbi:hypothetical protein ACJMK2_042990 [Sinanodonta woodiana]|uniref:DUF5577 domain-containing protein n=1 Tax=Sinanodonta woodiana TaxID=1069815 RepID=A0ABD3VYN4_SINWO
MASRTTSDMSYWIQFFKDAGIPVADAVDYAVIFSDNRISKENLIDLNKDYLNDMDITIIGDVISILKHAKDVYTQESRDNEMKNVSSTTSQRRRNATVASRIIRHILGLNTAASPLNEPPALRISRDLSARLGISKTEEKTRTVVNLSTMPRTEIPVTINSRVLPKYEGSYVITQPSGDTEKCSNSLKQKRKLDGTKTSVFDRLVLKSQRSKSAITVTGLSKFPMASASSVFDRLGKTSIKRAATSIVKLDDDDDDHFDDEFVDNKDDKPLLYAGVLKNGTRLAKLSAAKKAKKIRIEELGESPSTFRTHGVLAPHAEKEHVSVKARLGHKVDNDPAADSRRSSFTLKLNQEDKGVHSRLRPQKSPARNTLDSKSVFRRLGKRT